MVKVDENESSFNKLGRDSQMIIGVGIPNRITPLKNQTVQFLVADSPIFDQQYNFCLSTRTPNLFDIKSEKLPKLKDALNYSYCGKIECPFDGKYYGHKIFFSFGEDFLKLESEHFIYNNNNKLDFKIGTNLNIQDCQNSVQIGLVAFKNLYKDGRDNLYTFLEKQGPLPIYKNKQSQVAYIAATLSLFFLVFCFILYFFYYINKLKQQQDLLSSKLNSKLMIE